MGNPLDHVTQEFWELIRDLDKLLAKTDKKFGPLTYHVESLRLIDTDRIRHVARLWSGNPGSIKDLAIEAKANLDSSRRDLQVLQGWSGSAYLAFQNQMDNLDRAIDTLISGGPAGEAGPADKMAKFLNDFADSIEASIGKLVKSLSRFGGVIKALESTDAASKVIELAMDPLITLLTASFSAELILVDSLLGEIRAVNQITAECHKLIKKVEIN